MRAPIRLAIVDDYAVVVAGVASFLAGRSASTWSRPGRRLPVITDVDIVLYDTFGQVQGKGIDLEDFVRDSGAKVVIYSWNLRPELIERAIAEGASGYLSKVLTGPAIVEALERIMNGEVVILAGDHETSVGGAGDWPGRSAGLSPREAEVIALITQGLSNQEIADRAYLSINSIKTYIRSAYRKIGVERRTQAVLWAVANGFVPDTRAHHRRRPTAAPSDCSGQQPRRLTSPSWLGRGTAAPVFRSRLRHPGRTPAATYGHPQVPQQRRTSARRRAPASSPACTCRVRGSTTWTRYWSGTSAQWLAMTSEQRSWCSGSVTGCRTWGSTRSGSWATRDWGSWWAASCGRAETDGGHGPAGPGSARPHAAQPEQEGQPQARPHPRRQRARPR